jgi:hypothetical protein
MIARTACGAALVLVCATAAHAGSLTGSALALPLVDPGAVPGVTVLQRTISREWGPSEDSTYVTVNVPGYKSEGWAAVMSGALPGSGQYYVGENSAVWWALAEAAGWTAYAVFTDRSDLKKDQAQGFAGNPDSTSSNWSFQRWSQSTGNATADLQRLYAGDPDAFFYLIGHNDTYLSGWAGNSSDTRSQYRGAYDESQQAKSRAHMAIGVLWLNHLLSAVDALRAARNHNLRLNGGTQLKVRTSWHDGGPAVRAPLERRF